MKGGAWDFSAYGRVRGGVEGLVCLLDLSLLPGREGGMGVGVLLDGVWVYNFNF